MDNLNRPYNTCADIRIQMLGSDGAAFAVGKPASAALEADAASFHAHVYREDGSWEVRIFDAEEPRQPAFETVEAAIGHAVLTAPGRIADEAPTAGEKTLDAVAPRARTPDAVAACR